MLDWWIVPALAGVKAFAEMTSAPKLPVQSTRSPPDASVLCAFKQPGKIHTAFGRPQSSFIWPPTCGILETATLINCSLHLKKLLSSQQALEALPESSYVVSSLRLFRQQQQQQGEVVSLREGMRERLVCWPDLLYLQVSRT